MFPIFQERLKHLRKEKGMSQTEVAKALNYGIIAIANYENGRMEPSLGDLCRLADFFDVRTDYLLGRTDDRRSHYRAEDFHNLLCGVSFFDVLKLVISQCTKENKE